MKQDSNKIERRLWFLVAGWTIKGNFLDSAILKLRFFQAIFELAQKALIAFNRHPNYGIYHAKEFFADPFFPPLLCTGSVHPRCQLSRMD